MHSVLQFGRELFWNGHMGLGEGIMLLMSTFGAPKY